MFTPYRIAMQYIAMHNMGIDMAAKSTKSFRISPEIAEALSAAAAKVDRSEGWIIEKALTIFLRDRGLLPKEGDQQS